MDDSTLRFLGGLYQNNLLLRLRTYLGITMDHLA